jgi:UDP-N-acetylmuramoyl-tripeptide--D-alanyl-D-alanine ligase
MIPMSLAEIAGVVAGDVADADPDLPVTGEAFIDSRTAVPGGLFVALPGARVDGHEFAAAAVAAGAAAVLASRPVGVPAVVVDDVVSALGELARHVVSRLPRLCTVGVTGSQGKTSTKDMLAQVLERAGDTVATAQSFNNEIGTPLTALRVTEATRYLVAEMGARGRGHIRYLTSLVRPTAGLVLNVGVAHLGEFGSQADIAAAKGELVESLPADGLAALNADDPLVLAMSARTQARVLTFGTGPECDLRLGAVVLDADGFPQFSLAWQGQEADLTVPLVGAHQAVNSAAAAAVALGLGMDIAAVAAALSTVSARSRWRMEVTSTSDGVTVINDAYNANPDSMRAALDALVGFGRRRGPGARTFAVLGEMLELGERGPTEHEMVGRLAARLDVTRLVVVGEGARPVHAGAEREASAALASTWVPDAAAAIELLQGAVRRGDVVLVKASRAAGLERVALALTRGDAANTTASDLNYEAAAGEGAGPAKQHAREGEA